MALQHQSLVVIGITGSIGCGKSTIAQYFRQIGFQVFDADAVVHKLYAVGGAAVPQIQKLFPDVVCDGAVDRSALSQKLLLSKGRNGAANWTALENIVHPLINVARDEFLAQQRRRGAGWAAALDLPLLLEPRFRDEPGAARALCNAVVCARCEEGERRGRVLQRPGWDAAKLAMLDARQLGPGEKARLSDFVVDTSDPSLVPARAQAAAAAEALLASRAGSRAYAAWAAPAPPPPPVPPPPPPEQRRPLPPPPPAAGALPGLPPTVVTASEGVSDMLRTQKLTPGEAAPQLWAETGHWPCPRREPGDKIQAITFDLDDTLFPVMPPILRALESLFSKMSETMPLAMAAGARKRMRQEMREVMAGRPLLRHDLTAVRREALRRLALKAGDPEEGVDQALDVFMSERSKVGQDLYSDVLPVLQWFKDAGYRLGAISNGNTDITKAEELRPFFDFCITPCLVGAQKPSPVPFLAAMSTFGLKPYQVVHVGDAWAADVRGAVAVGLRACLHLVRRREGGEGRTTAEEGRQEDAAGAAARGGDPLCHDEGGGMEGGGVQLLLPRTEVRTIASLSELPALLRELEEGQGRWQQQHLLQLQQQSSSNLYSSGKKRSAMHNSNKGEDAVAAAPQKQDTTRGGGSRL